MQEAALRAFRAFENFKGEDGKVWLLVIVRNLFYTSISRKPPESAVFDEEIHAPGESSGNPEVLLFRDMETGGEAGYRAARAGVPGGDRAA